MGGNVLRKKSIIADKPLLIAVLSLSLFGLLMQYSASSYSALMEFNDSFFYVKKQAVALVVGIVAMVVVALIDPSKLYKFRYIIYIFSIILLALVFVPVIGVENYGARRWLNLGFTTIQPSEIAKFALVIVIAAQLSKKSAVTFKSMGVSLLATAIICVLIMLEPNMSITMCVAFTALLMLVVGGMKFKHITLLAIPAIALVIVMIVIEPYRLKRLLAFLDPWASPLGEGYQLIQSYYALSGGGFFGLGLFNSRQKYMFLPFAESDFIFSIIGEELGLFGCIAVMAVYMFIIYRGIKIAINASSRFESYLSIGITLVIAIQVLLNIAVVTGSIPPTGLPLPFVSNGGSSLVVFLCGIGILEKVAFNSLSRDYIHKI